MSKIFLTGATGLIGGEVLYRLAGPGTTKYKISCLVRDQAKAAIVQKAYPSVRITHGDLDDVDTIESEAKNADIVLSLASTRHAPSSNAIAKGLNAPGRNGPAYWVQISGASLFSGPDIKNNTYGEEGGKVYDDLADQDEIWSLVEQTPTRVVEQLIDSQDPTKVKTALIIGPLIYGTGRGPVNTSSIQGVGISRYTLENGRAFYVGKGQSSWSNISVRDIGALVVGLVEASAVGTTGVWNKEGVYCPANGIMTWAELAKSISEAAKAKGYIAKAEVESFDTEKVNQFMGHGALLLGSNAKQTASRARERLGWQPSEPSLEEFVPIMVDIEAKRLGKVR